jgi:tRNA dimethylallyltransferase
MIHSASSALEVCYASGRPMSELQQSTQSALGNIPLRAWALVPASRETLNERLDLRLRRMMDDGFLTEVRTLHARGDLTADHPAVRAVGYRQLWAHFAGECPLDEAVRRAITATRQLAKRQMTWIRSEPGLTWVNPFDPGGYERWGVSVDEWLSASGLRRPELGR